MRTPAELGPAVSEIGKLPDRYPEMAQVDSRTLGF